jgi:hypothetical protein
MTARAHHIAPFALGLGVLSIIALMRTGRGAGRRHLAERKP